MQPSYSKAEHLSQLDIIMTLSMRRDPQSTNFGHLRLGTQRLSLFALQRQDLENLILVESALHSC